MSAIVSSPARETSFDPAALGIEVEYRDAHRQLCRSNPDTLAAIARTLSMTASPSRAAALVVRHGNQLPDDSREILTEDGRVLPTASQVARSVPFGYHQLVMADGSSRQLIVSPGRCYLPDDLHGWGWAVQLYAARSQSSWGVGDLTDLATLTEWSAQRGARFILINPLHAPLATAHQEPSPYFASSRLFRNPLYIRVEEVPGADLVGTRLLELQASGRALNSARQIDRDSAWRLKQEALLAIWQLASPFAGFAEYCQEQGETLRRYATFCVLTEELGPGWRNWPEAYRHPNNAAVLAAAERHSQRVSYHMWLQWLVWRQLRNTQRDGVALMHDLAVGVNPDGADCWSWPDAFVADFTVGAPPDRFNTLGQNWAQPPFNPIALRGIGYQPFIEMFRATFAAGGAVRIDHIMGLFRLWWIGNGAAPTDGAYVRYPARELLDLLALESWRAKAFVVGEDLGTVERGVRPELRRRRILNYRLLVFGGKQALARYPVQALTAVTTHDLPTIAGLWTGSDLAAQRKLGLAPNEAGTENTRRRLVELTGALPTTQLGDVVMRTHQALATAPSRLLGAALDDAALSAMRPNMPGTVAPTWPNWEIPLPMPLEEVLASPVAESIATDLQRR